jgi:hypothetical protein
MFGQLKENIFYSLDQVKSNPDELKARFNNYVSALKSSSTLKKLHEVYEQIEKAQFDNETIALQFIDECLAELKGFDKSELAKLTSLVNENVKVKTSIRIKAFDELLFNESLNIKNKYDQKTLVIKQLTKTNQKKVDYKEIITNLDKKVNTSVAKLTTEQKEALEIFVENDNAKLKTYYTNLIESTIDLIETKLLSEDNVDINKTLIASKRKLKELQNEAPNIETVERIVELKADLNA